MGERSAGSVGLPIFAHFGISPGADGSRTLAVLRRRVCIALPFCAHDRLVVALYACYFLASAKANETHPASSKRPPTGVKAPSAVAPVMLNT